MPRAALLFLATVLSATIVLVAVDIVIAPPITTAQQAAGGASPAPPSGVALASAAEVCGALVDLGEGWDAGRVPPRLRTFLPESGVLHVPVNRRGAECEASLPSGLAPSCERFRCDGALERCTDGRSVFLLRRGAEGLHLRASIAYETGAPESGLGDAAVVVDRRDRVCELYSLVRARRIGVDPVGYRVQLASRDVNATYRGARARREATRDLGEFAGLGVHLKCTQSDCSHGYASNEAELMGYLLARRTAAGYVLSGHVDMLDDAQLRARGAE
jgi:hypothetical protein